MPHMLFVQNRGRLTKRSSLSRTGLVWRLSKRTKTEELRGDMAVTIPVRYHSGLRSL